MGVKPANVISGTRTRRKHVKKYRTRAHLAIGSLNIRGGGSATTHDKWQQISVLMKQRKLGVLAVQETHLTKEATARLNAQFEGRLRIHNSSDNEHPNAQGVAIIVDETIARAGTLKTHILVQGRAMITEVPWKGSSTSLNILIVYAPNGKQDNASFWETLDTKLDQRESPFPKPDFVLGDFNIVEDAIDRSPPSKGYKKGTKTLALLLEHLDMEDGWRHENPEMVAYSPTQEKKTKVSKSRIDRIYCKGQRLRTTCNWSIESHPIASDHQLASMMFYDISTPYKGKGRWSIPEYLIQNDRFVEELSREAVEVLKQMEAVRGREQHSTGPNPQTLFAAYKERVLHKAKSRAKREVPQSQAKIEELADLLTDIENDTSMGEAERAAQAALIYETIKELETKRLHNDRIKSRTKFSLEHETVGKYWINLSKEKRPRDTIYGLRNPKVPEGPMIHKSCDMAEAARDYHEKMQGDGQHEDTSPAERDARIDEVLTQLDIMVEGDDWEDLNTMLTWEDIHTALNTAPCGKSPGFDGIPSDIWLKMSQLFQRTNKGEGGSPYTDIVQMLTLVYNDIEKFGLVEHSDFAKGWMCPLYKKKDKSDIANYRPITVLNADYKTFTKALSIKL
ncbi:Endonuclease/exonuclease/phosphatase, partial [Coprinopsis sp. MPI-PUGE-AT-0042]